MNVITLNIYQNTKLNNKAYKTESEYHFDLHDYRSIKLQSSLSIHVILGNFFLISILYMFKTVLLQYFGMPYAN